MVLDGHSDLLFDVTRRRLAGETRVLERRHLERLRRGNVEGMVLSIWADPEDGVSYRRRTEEIFACARAELAECPWLEIVRTAAEAKENAAAAVSALTVTERTASFFPAAWRLATSGTKRPAKEERTAVGQSTTGSAMPCRAA